MSTDTKDTKQRIREAEGRSLTGMTVVRSVVEVPLLLCDLSVEPPPSPHKPSKLVLECAGGPEVQITGCPLHFRDLRDLLSEYFGEAEADND